MTGTKEQWRHDFRCPATHCSGTVAVITTKSRHSVGLRPYCQTCGRTFKYVGSQKTSNLRGRKHEILFSLDVDTLTLCRGALAALTQNKTHPADIKCAKSWIKAAIENQERT